MEEALTTRRMNAIFPVELESRILDNCDLLTLYACHDAYPRLHLVAQQVLGRSRDRIVRRFALGAYQEFLDVLHDHNAVVTGMAALAFILRDETFTPNEITVAVGSSGGPHVEEYLVRRFCAHQVPDRLAGQPITARLRPRPRAPSPR